MAARKQSMAVEMSRKQSVAVDLARKQSMADSLGRKPSVDRGRKPSVDRGRRVSIDKGARLDIPMGMGRRGSIMDRRPSFMFDRKMSMADSLAGRSGILSSAQRERMAVKYENTYRLEPEELFSGAKAKAVAQDILESTLKDQEYNKDDCSKLSRSLADTIKQHVKALNYTRYKIVTMVAIGEGSEMRPSAVFTSRCVWNAKMDTFCEATYKNKSLYAVALVYALYVD